MKNMWTIELNLDESPFEPGAFHIDFLDRTISKNIEAALSDRKTNRWVIVGLLDIEEDPNKYLADLRNKMKEALKEPCELK